MNPEVVGVIGSRQTEGKATARTNRIFQPLLVNSINIERRISKDEVEVPGSRVRVVIIAVNVATVLYFTFEAMNSKVQTAKTAGFVGFFDTVDGKLCCRILFMLGNKAC